jgi:hypothetical protein
MVRLGSVACFVTPAELGQKAPLELGEIAHEREEGAVRNEGARIEYQLDFLLDGVDLGASLSGDWSCSSHLAPLRFARPSPDSSWSKTLTTKSCIVVSSSTQRIRSRRCRVVNE